MTQPTENKKNEWCFTNFELFEKSLNGGSTSHIHAIRKAAMERFAKLGFPTSRDEEWRFTNVSPIASSNFKPVLDYISNQVTIKSLQSHLVDGMGSTRLVFINGHFSPDLSVFGSFSNGVKVGNLSTALERENGFVNQYLTRYAGYDDNAFTALNTGFLYDGAFVFIPDGLELDDPIYLVFISTEFDGTFVSHPRNLIVAGRNAEVKVVEHYLGLAKSSYFTNAVTEIVAGQHSIVEHTKLQSESLKAYHIGSTYVHQDAASNVTSHSISFGGMLVRNNITAVLAAEGCECMLNGLSLSTGQQHIDNHTTIDHAKPHCNSHELYKSIIDGKSKGVFNGKILVRKDAQKTDAKQTNKTLLLSDNATMNTKPQLEIFADDVKCTHGATVGYLDAEALFYLRSRGIGVDAARDMLTYAFANDVTDRTKIEGFREYLNNMLHARLEQGRRTEG